MGGVLSIETGGSCPVNNYLHSGFLALQMIMDTTKIRVRSEYLPSIKVYLEASVALLMRLYVLGIRS